MSDQTTAAASLSSASAVFLAAATEKMPKVVDSSDLTRKITIEKFERLEFMLGGLGNTFRLYAQDEALPAELRQRLLRSAGETERFHAALRRDPAIDWLLTSGKSTGLKHLSISYQLHKLATGHTPEALQMMLAERVLGEGERFVDVMDLLRRDALSHRQATATLEEELGNTATAFHHEGSAAAN